MKIANTKVASPHDTAAGAVLLTKFLLARFLNAKVLIVATAEG
jgi:hypothetical protein